MAHDTRRQFLRTIGVAAGAGLAGCTGGGGGGGGTQTTTAGGTTMGEATTSTSLTPITVVAPEGTINYPLWEAGVAQGFFEDEGLDVNSTYKPFDAQAQSVTTHAVDTSLVSTLPYIQNVVKGEKLVSFGFNAGLLSVNALYVLASSDYQTIEDLKGKRIGVWSFGSSTVQAFEALVAEKTGLQLRKDFQTTTAAPPALVGLLKDGKVDAVIDVSGLTIAMEAAPDTFRNIAQLNNLWIEQSGNPLPLTSWWCYADWYDSNKDVAAALLRGAEKSVGYWRDNTDAILKQYGGPANVDNQAKIDVVSNWAQQGQVFQQSTTQDFLDSTWKFLTLMQKHGFLDQVPDQGSVMRNPL